MVGDASTLGAVVIGAGPFGLGVSYYLKKAGVDHIVFERGRVGETWRSQRWDSFRMNTPNAVTVMPEDPYTGPDPEGFMTAREFTEHLEAFARCHQLPIRSDCPVIELSRDEQHNTYLVTTPQGVTSAQNVVIASGCQNCLRTPRALAASLPGHLRQIHAADYRSPADLPPGAVLVIGSATSGVQIAEDLLSAGRIVYLSTSRVVRLPRRHRGRDIIIWSVMSGFLDEPADPSQVRILRRLAQPQLAAGHTISLQWLASRGAVLLGRLIGVSGPLLTFADDLVENIRFADEMSQRRRKAVDDYIAEARINAPPAEPDPGEDLSFEMTAPPIQSLDAGSACIASVIWCTGFDGEFGWIQLPVFDAEGFPVHTDGASSYPGLYFLGLPWLSCRRSMLIAGVEKDTRRIANWITARCSQTAAARE